MSDPINHPPHYTTIPEGFEAECIEYARHMMYAQGAAFKYLYRAGSKGDTIEDLLSSGDGLEVAQIAVRLQLPQRRFRIRAEQSLQFLERATTVAHDQRAALAQVQRAAVGDQCLAGEFGLACGHGAALPAAGVQHGKWR